MCRQLLRNYNDVEKYEFSARRKNFKFKKYVGEFTYERIDPDSIPENRYLYHLRGFDLFGLPMSIEPYVTCDFAGCLITKRKIKFPNEYDKYIELSDVKILDEEEEF